MKNSDLRKIDVLTEKWLLETAENFKSQKKYSGLKSGFKDLDNLTQGWQNGELIIISGRPSMGKTAFMISMIINMSVESKIPIGVFSLETTANQFIIKMLSNYCDIDSYKIYNGELTNAEWSMLDEKCKGIIDANIYIDCPARLEIQDLCRHARGLAENKGIKALFVDYIQLLTVTSKYSENRYNEINYISRELKALAKELNIPIFAISQMNRSSEANKDRLGYEGKKPRLSDLRDSGTLCDDADKVCFIFRPEYYNVTEDEEGNSLIGVAEILLAKNRIGTTAVSRLIFKKEINKFENVTNN